MLATVAELDRRDVWKDSGCRDMAQWVAARSGASRYKARLMVEAGYALESLPRISSALETGRLNLDRVLELARMATPENERQLIAWARRVSPQWIRHKADLERKKASRETKKADLGRHLYFDEDPERSMLFFNGGVPSESGQRFRAVIEELARDLPVTPEDDPEDMNARRADALMALVWSADEAANGGLKTEVLLSIPLETLMSRTHCASNDGTALHPSIAKKLCCDASIRPLITGEDGAPLALAEETYRPSRWLRRLVLERDEHRCTHPGCHMKRFVDIHHIKPWPLGATELCNLVTVCRFHHKLVHEYSWKVRIVDGVVKWFRPNGDPYDPAPVLARAGPSG